MVTIKISTDEETTYNDFKEGSPVQVRITVPPSEEASYVKGTTVDVERGSFKAKAKIVSDPLTIGSPLQGQDKTISLIIEKIK
jgi:hypothetical protein